MGTRNVVKNEPNIKNPWFGVYRNSEIKNLVGVTSASFQDSSFILIVNSGHLCLTIDGVKYVVERNGLFVVFPRVELSIIDMPEDFDGVLFVINANLVNYLSVGSGIRAYIQVVQCPLVQIDDQEREILLEAIDYVDRRSRYKMPYYSSQMYSNLIRGFCYEIACVVRKKLHIEDMNGSKKNQVFQRFIKEVMTHHATEHRVEFYAKQLGMSAKYLCMLVKEVSNIPPQSWINDMIIRNAKVLLSTTTLSINEITRQLNFPNPSFFCQYFKRSVGQTPLKYRKCYQ